MPEPPKPKNVELCVFCRRHPPEQAWRPFCSERCRMQDLARWADEGYRVAGEPGELVEDSEKATDPDD